MEVQNTATVKDTERILEGLNSLDPITQLEAVQNLKKLFKVPDRIFGKIKLESLLQNGRVSLENKTPEMSTLYSYGASLVSFIGRNSNLDLEILYQVELILGKLENESLTNEIITKLWNQLETTSAGYPDGILIASKSTIERTVLEWVVHPSDNRIESLSRLSVDSPKLFQSITSILYEVLVQTRAHPRVFEMINLFVERVKHECQKKGKSCLILYPKGCRRLVSMMRCPPELCAQGCEDVTKKVVSLLLEMYLTDRKRALILLSHFTEWVSIFKAHLENCKIVQ